jgi:UDP-N-acetylglucosamine 2-epimerase (non-hydrolysing)
VFRLLGGLPRLLLIEPLEYVAFVALMQRAELILTDSGGIQEEAPSLRKPVLVMREKTERPEGVRAGAAKLVGTQVEEIARSVRALLRDQRLYRSMLSAENPYGDGKAAQRIAAEIDRFLAASDVPASR